MTAAPVPKATANADAQLADILLSIDELARRGKITRNRAFAAWYAIHFFNIDEDDALEAAASDGGNDQGIDIVFPDESSQELIVLQAHCPENFSKVTGKQKWDAVVSSIPFVENPDNLRTQGRPDLADSIEKIRKDHPDYSATFGLISLGKRSDQIEGSLTAHAGHQKDYQFFYQAQEDIKSHYKALVDEEAGIAEDTLNFSGECFEDAGDYGRAWIGSVSAAELIRLHASHKDKLFAGNVRLFIGTRKGGINEQIIKTAQQTPGTFWALNNGVTIVADSATSIGTATQAALKLKRFSIVNGCQTTSSLARAGATDAKVLARVIAAKVGIKNEIVRYNNSQNPVKIWTVRAVDPIQEKLRKEFAECNISYAPKLEGSRAKRNPSIIELDKVTQYLAASDQSLLLPAIDNKSALFDEPYGKIFKKGIRAIDVYLAWLVGSTADVERISMAQGIGTDPNSGLLAVTSSYWIVYATYKLLARFSDMHSPNITLEKMNTVDFKNALTKYVAKAGELYWDASVDTYDRADYGPIKSTLRSSKFLQKMESKLNSRIAKLDAKALPDLVETCKSSKVKK